MDHVRVRGRDLNVTTWRIFKLGRLVVAGHATVSHEACFRASHVCEFCLLISVGQIGKSDMKQKNLIYRWDVQLHLFLAVTAVLFVYPLIISHTSRQELGAADPVSLYLIDSLRQALR